jgi:hypothetical protein
MTQHTTDQTIDPPWSTPLTRRSQESSTGAPSPLSIATGEGRDHSANVQSVPAPAIVSWSGGLQQVHLEWTMHHLFGGGEVDVGANGCGARIELPSIAPTRRNTCCSTVRGAEFPGAFATCQDSPPASPTSSADKAVVMVLPSLTHGGVNESPSSGIPGGSRHLHLLTRVNEYLVGHPDTPPSAKNAA